MGDFDFYDLSVIALLVGSAAGCVPLFLTLLSYWRDTPSDLVLPRIFFSQFGYFVAFLFAALLWIVVRYTGVVDSEKGTAIARVLIYLGLGLGIWSTWFRVFFWRRKVEKEN